MHVYTSRRIWEGRIVNLRVDELDAPDGVRRRTVEVVEHPGGVGVIARPTARDIVLVRQYRHPVEEYTWEIPAGRIEPDEDPALTARRELLEESGYRCERLEFVFSFYSTPGFCSERIRLYAAYGLTPGRAQPEEDESFELRVWPIEEAWGEVEADRIRDSKTQLGLAWARMHPLEVGGA